MTAEAAATAPAALIELQRQLATAHADIDALQADPGIRIHRTRQSHVHDAQQAPGDLIGLQAGTMSSRCDRRTGQR